MRYPSNQRKCGDKILQMTFNPDNMQQYADP